MQLSLYEDAIEPLRKCVQLDSEGTNYLRLLSDAYYLTGMKSSAKLYECRADKIDKELEENDE